MSHPMLNQDINPADPLDPRKKNRIIKHNNALYQHLDSELRVGLLLKPHEFKEMYLDKGWKPFENNKINEEIVASTSDIQVIKEQE